MRMEGFDRDLRLINGCNSVFFLKYIKIMGFPSECLAAAPLSPLIFSYVLSGINSNGIYSSYYYYYYYYTTHITS